MNEAIDSASELSELVQLHNDNEARLGQTMKDFVQAYSKKDYEAAKIAVVHMKFWLNVRNRLKDRGVIMRSEG